ncbi:MAG: hypothetical protein IPJ80_10215 [Saprospiraceae bacterium]|nr:hypothetical protein [Saprospiraceae bacterium]
MKVSSFLLIASIVCFWNYASKAQNSDISYLTVLSPNRLIKVYHKDSSYFRAASSWGALIQGPNLVASATIPQTDAFLCNSDNSDFNGKIVLINRGTCEFSTKALHAQNLGAIAVIIVNFENALLTMGAGAVGNQVHIPVLFVTNEVGAPLIEAVKNQESVVLSIGNSPEGFSFLNGRLIHDENTNCKSDIIESSLSYWSINIEDKTGYQYRIKSNEKGYYYSFLNPENSPYKLNLISPNNSWFDCEGEKIISTGKGDTSTVDFLAKGIKDCVELHTEISSSRLIRCFPTSFTVQVCNLGTLPAENAFVDVKLAKFFDPIENTNINFSLLNPDLYRFNLNTIKSNQCIEIKFIAKVSCDSAQLGQTLCYSAHAYPDTSCKELSALWSGANLIIKDTCTYRDVVFDIHNNGTGDMTKRSTYLVFKDDQLYRSAQFQLAKGKTETIIVPADGSTWHVQANQEAYNPKNSIVYKTNEACSGNGTFNTGFALNFPIGEEGFASDEDCREVRGAYDPNEKEAIPRGNGPDHLINLNTEIEYTIHFQNTGNDTAYNIIVEDELPAALDVKSIHSLNSSHPFQLEIFPKAKLVFKFNKIALVDSFANEPKSHGFVSFKIKQNPNNAIGTQIENKADIFFDFNPPISTNYTFHEVGITRELVSNELLDLPDVIELFPNPGSPESEFQLQSNEYDKAKWKLIDLNGTTLASGRVLVDRISFPVSINLNGVYILELELGTHKKLIKKLIIN